MRYPFNEFTNLARYKELKNQIASNDYKSRYDPKSDDFLSLDSPVLFAYSDYDGNFHEERTVVLEDLIIEYIDITARETCRLFVNNLQKNNHFTSANISQLGNSSIEILNLLKTAIDKADFIEKEVRESLEHRINTLQEFYTRYVQNQYPEIKRKLEFNLNRSEVTYLFHVLRARNIIQEIPDADLARILQNMFKYKYKDGDYRDIKSIKGLISDFNNPAGEKSEVNPAETLENIFGKEGFFLV